MNLYDVIEQYLGEGRGGVLGTIIKKLGATPQGSGAKVFLGEDFRLHGTIGGGCVEAEATREARWLMGGKDTKVIHYTMTGTEVAEEGMICGGNVDIFLEPVLPVHRDLYTAIRSCVKSGRRARIITAVGDGRFFKMVQAEDGEVWGEDPKDLPHEVTGGSFGERKTLVKAGFLVEPINPKPRLYLYGAGHISQFISRIAAMVDFDITVIDDRMSFANRDRFPEAERVIAGFFDEVLRDLDPAPEDYHVIVTRGHKNDAEVLESVLTRPSAYVGMIGSRRKTKIVYDHVAGRGVDARLLENVHAPIGLDIEAETPQEIAVSIVAELVKVRGARKKQG